MAQTATTDVAYLSKILYPKGYDPKLLYRNKPLLNDITKKRDFTSGQGLVVPADYALTTGIGTLASDAVTNANPSLGAAFLVPQKELNGFVYMDRRVWENAMNGDDLSQFVDYGRKQSDDANEMIMRELHRQAYGTYTGLRAQCSATVAPATTVITLARSSDTVYFQVGDTIVASATDGAALAAGTPGYSTIIGINYDNATLTMNGTITTQITGISTGWCLYKRGIATGNSTSNLLGAFHGLADWVPATVPATSFLGVADRTVSPTQLAGSRYTDTQGNIETLFIRARSKALTEVGNGYVQGEIYLHPLQFASMVTAKEGAKVIENDDLYKMGIMKMRLGQFVFVEDAMAPLLAAYSVGPGSFELQTCGDQPKMGKPWDDPDVGQIKIPLYVYGNFVGRKLNQIQRITLNTP